MKKNGFTLAEILAVLVILALIAIITTPIVIGVLADARKNTFENSVEELINVINMDYNEYGRINKVEYTFDGDKLTCKADKNELDYTGEMPVEEDATLINTNGKISGEINNGEFTATIVDNEVTITENK